MIKLHMLTTIPSSCLCIQLSVCATAPIIFTNFVSSHMKILFDTDKNWVQILCFLDFVTMFQVWFPRTVYGSRPFCVYQIVSEILQPERKICQRNVRILFVIPLSFWFCIFRDSCPSLLVTSLHFALILNLKMRLMQPCFQRLGEHLRSASPVIAVQRKNLRITLERSWIDYEFLTPLVSLKL